MSSLIVWLGNNTDPQATYPFVITKDGQNAHEHGHAPAALLPDMGRGADIVAIVPATRLSWHEVRLPKGIGNGSPRLRQVLDGLLEDKLLGDVARMHLALEPTSGPHGETHWVAACEREWLRQHLQALEQALRPVVRIVPEMAPQDQDLSLRITGSENQETWLLASGANQHGVLCMPLSHGAMQLLPQLDSHDAADSPPDVQDWAAEPAAVQAAETITGWRMRVQSRADRLTEAARSDWDLAQMEFASTGWARTSKRATQLWRDLLHGANWRPLRWGLIVLTLANIAGINALAWQEQRAHMQRQEAMRAMLTQSFPHVRLVVDAPIQMEREIAQLRRTTGATSNSDFDVMLTAIAQHLPGQIPTEVLYTTPAELTLRGLSLSPEQLDHLNQALSPMNLSARHIDADLLVTGAGS